MGYTDEFDDDRSAIRYQKFHVVPGPLPAEASRHVLESSIPLPISYKRFLVTYGGGMLFRRGTYYWMEIFPIPQETAHPNHNGQTIYVFAKREGSFAYFPGGLLSEEGPTPVREYHPAGGDRLAANCFEDWFANTYRKYKKKIRKPEWNELLAGPQPFNELEVAILEARRLFECEPGGPDSSGDIVFKVRNGSSSRLIFLTLSVSLSDGRHLGGIWLDVSCIGPGETKSVSHDVYKDRHNADELEISIAPDPSPEDRSVYWEFRIP